MMFLAYGTNKWSWCDNPHQIRKLTDLARYARIFKLRLSKEVIQGLEGVTSSWTGYIPLNLVLF
uniref:Uncharacterized protein n=1 Tax=Helianthus annuus TaxID=4232 RepID=A0A251RQW8_HELAN